MGNLLNGLYIVVCMVVVIYVILHADGEEED